MARPIDAPSSCFLLAVTVSNLFGGLGPGLFSIALSALAFGRFFLWRDLPQSTEATVLRFTVFLAAVFLIAVLMEIKRRVEESRNRAEEELRGARADLAHVNRATAMGELTASLAHEVNQPIAAAVTDANTCLRWLSRDQPDLREAREAASRVVKDAIRASEIITRVRSLYKKGRAQRDLVDMNEVIREMVILLRSQAARNSVSIRTELSEDLPPIMGDRIQLQQVLMNLMINSIEAMNTIEGPRDLIVTSLRAGDEKMLVSVTDTGAGLPPQQPDQIFNAFFTTKRDGTGMGLRISRTIVESHGGLLWVTGNPPRGASFHFTLPRNSETHE